jgi:5-methylthioribose kinase
MGYDIGNVIGNLFFALVNRKHLMLSENKDEFINWLKDTIKNIFDMFKEKFIKKYDLLVKDSIYINPKFKNWYLNTILSDSIGMAGLEIIRRVVGDSKVLEITAIENIEKRVVIERELIEIGIRLIKNREIIKEGKDLF